MILSDNQTPTSVKKFFKDHTNSKDPSLNFFVDRYSQAYKDELKDFIKSISQGISYIDSDDDYNSGDEEYDYGILKKIKIDKTEIKQVELIKEERIQIKTKKKLDNLSLMNL